MECKKRNVNTPDATEALELLAPYVRPKLVVAQFRHHIARGRDNDHEKEGQRQVLRATFPWIRNSIKELIGTEMDALARDFPDMHDIRGHCLQAEPNGVNCRGSKESRGEVLRVKKKQSSSPGESATRPGNPRRHTSVCRRD